MSSGKVVQLVLGATRARAIIRECCGDTNRLIWTEHAIKQMIARRISPQQVINCLLRGQLYEGPARSPRGDWKCTLRYTTAGTRIEVAVAINVIAEPTVTVVVTTY
jgi:hypothetical protein